MPAVIMKGWKDGMRKVDLSRLQVDLLELSLKEAKSNVDSLLNNNTIEITVKDYSIASEFVEKARDLGVLCDLKNESS
jgi:hypothetical protein